MGQSRTKKSTVNAMCALIARMLTLILGFVSRAIFLKFLTTEYLGVNGLFSNVLTMLSFAELGIGNAIQFSLYKPLKEGDEDKIKTLMHFYKNAYKIIGISVLALGVALLPFMDFIVEEKPSITENLTLIYLLFIGNSAVSYLFSYKQTLFQADQKAYVVTLSNSCMAVIQNIVHILVLFLTKNYLVYLIGTIACTILNNLFIAWLANRRYPYLKDKEVNRLNSTEKKALFTNVKALSISKVAGVACNGTDNIIITKLLGLTSVGLVSNYTLIINTMSGMVYSMLTGMTGSVGNLNAEEDLQKRKQIFNQLMMLSYLIYASISTCLIVLINHFIAEVWLGAQYVIDMKTIVALVLIAFQSGMNFTAYTFRTTVGCFNEVKYIYVATAFLNIILSILLGKWLGLAGVFLATTISKLLTCELADGYYAYKRALNISPMKYFVKLISYYALFAVNVLICYLTIECISIAGLWGFLVKGCVCFALSNLVNILALYQTEAFRGLLKKVKLLIRRKTRRA